MQKQEAQHHGTFIAAKIGSQRKELHCTRCCRSQRVSTGSTSSKPPLRVFQRLNTAVFSDNNQYNWYPQKRSWDSWSWPQAYTMMEMTATKGFTATNLGGPKSLKIMKWSGNGWDFGFAPIFHRKKGIDLHQRSKNSDLTSWDAAKHPSWACGSLNP